MILNKKESVEKRRNCLLIKFQFTLFILFPCIKPYKNSNLHILHCTWLGCIRSCMEDSNNWFLTNRWLVHNQFMGQGNPLEVLMHHLLIRGMTSLGYRDRFPMSCALVCMVTNWTTLIVISHNLKLSSSHEFTKLLYCIVSQPWEDIELILKFIVTLNYGWDHKLIIYFLWIGSLLMEVENNKYSQ